MSGVFFNNYFKGRLARFAQTKKPRLLAASKTVGENYFTSVRTKRSMRSRPFSMFAMLVA